MELSDMLDVLHFIFEEDSRFVSAEEAESVTALRSSLYRNFYGTSYAYGSPKKNVNVTANNDGFFSDPSVTKPYIPPTEFDPDSFNPYQSLLDAPIG
jgi:hypothetical protein